MRGLTNAAMLLLAVTGLSACNRNKAANNSTTANVAAPVTPAPAAAPMDPAAFRTAMADQCASQVRANPNMPAGFDVAGACSCATEAALTGQADPLAFAQTPEGQQVFAQALAQCLQQSAGAGAPGAADGETDANAKE